MTQFDDYNPNPNGSRAESVLIMSFKIVTVQADLFLCHAFDANGAVEGKKEYAVKRVSDSKKDDIIYAVRPHGGTDKSYTGGPVVWVEMASKPQETKDLEQIGFGTLDYQVLMTIFAGSVPFRVWDHPRFY